jgi:uncharacterized membrane protein
VNKSRLEAFSDGVLAVILTIMVLEIHAPHGGTLAALREVCPALLAYVVSFGYVAIYWNNHHHLFHATRLISGGIMWANLHLLFWLSLVPATTAWVGQNPNAPLPAALYGVVLLMAALAWLLLVYVIVLRNGHGSEIAQALGNDMKGKLSWVLYTVAIGLAFVHPWIADAIYALVACIWIVPDRRIESRVTAS